MFAFFVCAKNNSLNLLFIGRVQYFLWNEAVETSIGSPSQSLDVFFHCFIGGFYRGCVALCAGCIASRSCAPTVLNIARRATYLYK